MQKLNKLRRFKPCGVVNLDSFQFHANPLTPLYATVSHIGRRTYESPKPPAADLHIYSVKPNLSIRDDMVVGVRRPALPIPDLRDDMVVGVVRPALSIRGRGWEPSPFNTGSS